MRALKFVLLSLTGLLLVGIVIIVGVQIVYRYVLSSPLSWTEELARLMFIWLVFLGAALAVMQRAHLKLDLLDQRMSPLVRATTRKLDVVVKLLFSTAVIYAGWRIVDLTASRQLPGTGLSYAWFHSAAPIGAAIMLLAVIVSLRTGRPNEERPD